jgi:hypothetical protein
MQYHDGHATDLNTIITKQNSSNANQQFATLDFGVGSFLKFRGKRKGGCIFFCFLMNNENCL